MKEIKAYIKAIKLNEVTKALHEIEGLDGASISEVQGFGRGKANSGNYSHDRNPSGLVKHLKLEVVCQNELEETIVDAIHRAAHTGHRGDGKIYVSDISKSVRIQNLDTQ